MNRRRFLAAGGVALGTATAGCGGLFETESVDTGGGEPAVPEDRPDAVYVPSHVEGMQMANMTSSGRYRFALAYSFPHRFWLVTGGRRRLVEVEDDHTVHLMLSVWDGETGAALPSSTAPIVVRRDGETLVDRAMWGMLSQNMGVHFGDNVGLDGDGTYEVAVDYGPLPSRQLGGFAGELGEAASVSIDLEFSREDLRNVSFERLGERAGERGAVSPMSMEMMPSGQLPEPADLPGRLLGEGKSGDAVLAAVALASPPAGIDDDGTYLAVSARTPYNRYPIPRMDLSASIDGGESVELTESLHPELGYHYGAVVEAVPAGSELSVVVDSPPSVARHEGYETAFIDMPPATIQV